MAEIKGMKYNEDKVKFLTHDGGDIDGDLTITGNLIVDGEVKGPVKIVSFADGTDEEIAAMLDAHYNGEIDISEYWNVGDTRVVHIDATNSGTRAHIAQNMTMIIMGFNHDDLVTAINGKTKAAISIGFKEAMGNAGNSETEYYWGSKYSPVVDEDNYLTSPLRTWLNGELLNALPNTFSALIKEVKKNSLKSHDSSKWIYNEITGLDIKMFWKNFITTNDKIWLLSYTEIFGEGVRYQNYMDNNYPFEAYEGYQYEYLKINSNRIKYVNNNGAVSSNTCGYWLRSPSSGYNSIYGYFWCSVDNQGAAYTDVGYYTYSLAPAFCL